MENVPFGDTPRSRCQFYRRVCDLPAWIDPPEIGRIVMRADHVWGLMMPSALGLAVHGDLRRSRDHDSASGVGPIISHMRSGRWTFLIRPDLPDDTALFAEMFRLDVSVVRTGATIALPSPTDQGERFRRWIQPPRSPFRPSGLTVIDSIRTCAGRGGWLRTPKAGYPR
ncbi:DNA-directed RNA polymerase subunit beta [Nocardia cyriacigeorgica]|uniref:DNA-directed RNA polymerase subunit beta n=1 Tax=Nocardia cyriacigeorgica TaxID=135487 RepID=A0A5R8PET9_9NOCA|nr:DNA-directed RNA polymerase subunit beta [Nocardia cyriacigeorgica]TLG12200.1 DNA-directed RNA polymerase subunit beta [Nocardia cyriacigeorgica]